jgi:hypothetical protein
VRSNLAQESSAFIGLGAGVGQLAEAIGSSGTPGLP